MLLTCMSLVTVEEVKNEGGRGGEMGEARAERACACALSMTAFYFRYNNRLDRHLRRAEHDL